MTLILNDAINYNTSLTTIHDSLSKLKELSLTTDYKDVDKRKVFFDYIIDVKRHYRRMEGVLSGKSMPLVRPTGMKVVVSKTINPSQMEAWINKIQKNMLSIESVPTLKMLKQQYGYLDLILKVLNGDAYFVGCQHPA